MLSAPPSSQYSHSHNNEHKKQTPEEYLEETGQMLDRSTAAHQSIPNINIQMYEPDTPVLPTPFTPYMHTPFHPINRHLGLHPDMDLLLMSPSMKMNPHSTHSIHSNNSTHLTPTLSATHFMHSPLPITFGQGHHHAPSPMINVAYADESNVYLGTSSVYSSTFNSTDILASPPADSENHFLDSFLMGGALDLTNSPMPLSSSAVDPLGNTESPTTAALGLPLFHHQQKKQNLSNLWINTSIASPQPQLQSPSQHMSYHHNNQGQSPMLQMPLSLHQQQATFLGDLQNTSLSMNSVTPNTFLTVAGTGVEFDSMSNYSQSAYGGDDDDLYLSLGRLSTPIPPSSINSHLSPYPQWTQHDSHSTTIGNFHSPLIPLPHPYPSSSASPNPKKRKASDQDDSPNKSTSLVRKPHACAYEGCTMSFDKQANLRQVSFLVM
ncbi:hypothetical protein BCR33DRAFT_81521 [Rhizoclosmatium globosum]|uniref:Uncharacterized protein n=1 Tax=Rhizoclosmatium globosum TaxID=329046 RepID=A0A1Y2CNL6_9FUNG|nr:hypothetical protein BCR33DRAFT_81521 [Rhizoclosmatium globosum]|eukprot:ORY47925.1 hypothetical protein BCR33DRAFT_81521 [Rhizoclosmatium globosum]